VSPNSFIEIIGGRRHANPSSAIGCLFSITIAASQPSDRRSMTLGNMRELWEQRLIALCLNDACGHEGLIVYIHGYIFITFKSKQADRTNF
jgi:hypothetical protein